MGGSDSKNYLSNYKMMQIKVNVNDFSSRKSENIPKPAVAMSYFHLNHTKPFCILAKQTLY